MLDPILATVLRSGASDGLVDHDRAKYTSDDKIRKPRKTFARFRFGNSILSYKITHKNMKEYEFFMLK